MTDFRPTLTNVRWRPLTVLTVSILTIAVACSNGDDDGAATTEPTEPPTTEATTATVEPAAEADAEPEPEPEAESDADADAEPAPEGETDPSAPAAPDFGSGTSSITLGEETFELAIGPGTGLCRDVFGIIQAAGEVTDGRDIKGEFMIPPLDWETYEDGRYDPPSVELEITSTGEDNGRWIADAGWAEEFDKVGMSQVDSYEKDGLTASGSATFANAWNAEAESIEGSFQISCAEE